MITPTGSGFPYPTAPSDITYDAMAAWLNADQVGFMQSITGKIFPEYVAKEYAAYCQPLVNDVAQMAGGASQVVRHGEYVLRLPDSLLDESAKRWLSFTLADNDLSAMAVYLVDERAFTDATLERMASMLARWPYHVVKPMLSFFLTRRENALQSLTPSQKQNFRQTRKRQDLVNFHRSSASMRALPAFARHLLNWTLN